MNAPATNPYQAPLDQHLNVLRGRTTHNSDDPIVRNTVQLRGWDACEYCLMPTFGRYEVEHIIPTIKGAAYQSGTLAPSEVPALARTNLDHLDNFAWSCSFCNAKKKDHMDGEDPYQPGTRVRLFDPRHDRWGGCFYFINDYTHIHGLNDIGRATVEVLGFNEGSTARGQRLNTPLATRIVAMRHQLYPPRHAVNHLLVHLGP